MAPLRQAVVLLFQCILFISASQTDKTLSELNEYYRPQIWTLLDFLNADPDRQFNYRIYKYVNSAQKTDEIIELEIEVGADCLDQNKCTRAVLQCKGYVQYFPDSDSHRALPGVQCEEKWNDNRNGIPDVSGPNVDEITERVRTPQIVPCLGCPREINTNAEGVDGLLKLALQHIESEKEKKHAIVEVVSVHRQIVAGVKYILIAKIAPTLCPNDPNLINAELCPVDEKAVPEYCRIEFFQKPTFSTDDHIVSNNCTASQEFAPKKSRDDFDNEINGYQKPTNPRTDGPNFEQIAQSGNFDGMTPERLAAVEAQIIPTYPTGMHPVAETTKAVIDNSQLGVDDIPSVQTSTNNMLQYGDNHEHLTQLQKTNDLQQKTITMEANPNTKFSNNDDIGIVYPDDSYEYLDKLYRTKRQARQDTSEESSEEAKKTDPAPLVKREVVPPTPPQSSESQDTSEEVGAEKKQVKRRAAPDTSESDTSEEVAKTPAAAQRLKRETPPKSSESSEETKDTNAQPVKRQTRPQSSESSEENKDVNAQRQASESSEEAKQGNAQIAKRQAPPQNSERQAVPQSSESSEEAPAQQNLERKKRGAKDSSSSSSSSSEEDKKNNDNGDDDDNGKHKKKNDDDDDDDDNGNHKKRHGKNKNDDDDDDNGNGKKSSKNKNDNGKDCSSSSSSSSDEDNNGNNRVKRAADDSSSSSSEDDDNNNGNDNGKHANDDVDDGKNAKQNGKEVDNNTSSSSDDDDDNGKNRGKRAADSSSSSSSSDEDNGNDNGNGKNHKENNKNENDNDTSSSSSSDDEDDKKNRGKREVPGLVRPNSDEKLVVRKVAEFAAKSFDDATHKHKLLEIENVKKLASEGTIYHIRIRVAVWKCLVDMCTFDGEKLCKLKVYVSPNGKMEVNKSHSHRIISEADKNRTDRFFNENSGEVDAINDEEVMQLVMLSREKIDKTSPDYDTKFPTVSVFKATKRIGASTLYKIKVKIGITDCSTDNCAFMDNSARFCEISASVQNGVTEGVVTNVTCDDDDFNTRSKRQVAGGISPVEGSSDEIKELMRIAVLELDPHTPHQNKYKILDIVESSMQVVQGILYRIKANLIISDCPKTDTKEAHECGQLQNEAPKTCNIEIWNRVWLDNGKNTTVTCGAEQYNFLSQPKHKLSKREMLVGAPSSANEAVVHELLSTTMVELDSRTPHPNKYKVVRVINSTSQVVAGVLYNITAEMALSDCLKTDNKEYHECGLLSDSKPEVCEIEIVDQPWLENGRKTTIKCPSEKYSFATNSKGRSKRQVPGGVSDARYDPIVIDLTKSSLLLADTRSPHDNKFKVVEILKATKQVTSGLSYTIKARVVISDCPKNDNREPEQCGQLESDTPRQCDISIGKETTVHCGADSYHFPSGKVAKRSLKGGITPVNVNNDEIKSLMRTAVLELDPHTPHQNKYKVLDVLESSKQVVQGMLYRIKANLILSECLKTDAKEAHECGHLQSEAPKTCNIQIWNRVWLDNGKNTTITCGDEHYNFLSQPKHKLSKRSVLVGAPSQANEAVVQELLSSTMVELDSRTPHANKYKVLRVLKSTSQVISGALYKITAEMALSDCLKTDNKNYHECELLSNSIPEICQIKIVDQPWLDNGRKTTINCPSEKYSFNTNSKPRSKRQALGAKTDINLDDQSITDLTKSTLLYLDSRSPHEVKYKIVEILDAKKQIVSGVKYYIKAKIILSDCKKYDSKDPVYCSEQKNATPRICDIKIWDQPWVNHGRKTNITCDTETYQYRTGRSSGNLLGQDNHDFHYAMFRKFMKDHNKNYKEKGELKQRFKIFMENMKKIEVLEKNEQGTGLYGPTKFADLTEEEFKKYLGYRPSLRAANEIPFAQAEIPDIELPKEFDWRRKHAVTEVKNQQQCGSCWAFSVTGNIEGQYALKYDKLVEFSEQELVDCDTIDEGCNGGLMDNAYRAIERMGGLESESDYPYDAKDEKCHFDKSLSRVQLSGAVNISHDETDMAKWLVKNGPISIAINANAMQFYMGGVSHPLKFLCSSDNLDHGVLIVGYGVHKYPLFNRTLPYWIVKNSWGTSWGEQGYYRVFRGDGTCGLNQTPSSAIVA